MGWRAGNSRNPAQYRENFSAGRIRNLEILSNWIISLAERSNCNRAYQSAISHRSSDYHNSRNSGIVSPWYRSISRYTYPSYVCFGVYTLLAVEATNSERKRHPDAGDLTDRGSRRVLRVGQSWVWRGKDLVTIGIFVFQLVRRASLIRIRIERVGSFLNFQERDRMIVSHFSMFCRDIS